MKIKNKKIYIVISLIISLVFIWILKANNISTTDEKIYFIKNGVTINSLAIDLDNKNLIHSKFYFKFLAKLTNKKIKAGYYSINNSTSVYDFLKKIYNGDIVIKNITLVEGLTVEQYYQQLNKEPAVLINETLDEIMLNIGIKSPYEGWLFPDTYQIKYGENITSIFQRAYKKMQINLDSLWQKKAKELPFKSPYEAIILASLIEKETAYNKEKPKISAVFLNRLKKNMRLQTDPSVIYALGDNYDGSLSKTDLMIKSPYNTYLNNGMPPSAISSVSYQSLYAAFNPDKNNYLYFISKKDGSHAFSDNYKKHRENIKHYLKN